MGEVSYGEALSAAWYASRTAKGVASRFEQAIKKAADAALWPKEQGQSGHRELRRAPLDWKPPKDENGFNAGMYDTRYGDMRYTLSEVDELIEEKGIEGFKEFRSRFISPFPNVQREDMGIYIHMTTTGVPVSPVFPDAEQGHLDLAAYASEYVTVIADDLTTAEAWHQRYFGDPETALS